MICIEAEREKSPMPALKLIEHDQHAEEVLSRSSDRDAFIEGVLRRSSEHVAYLEQVIEYASKRIARIKDASKHVADLSGSLRRLEKAKRTRTAK